MSNIPPKVPTVNDLIEIAKDFGIRLAPEEAEQYRTLMLGAFDVYEWMEQQEECRLPIQYPRTGGYRPDRADNPYNAWFWRDEISGAASGPLNGKRVGIKDTVCVAGLPMINGSRMLDGYIPDIDATVVTRLLDAGATILGKTTVNSGVGDPIESNSPFATVRNPRKPTHAPGGSSNGSAAALVAGDIDLAIGGDQGGSIRIPASWSGVVGLKPTYGLVPYTGILPIEMTIDHVGPMANNVMDLALMLSVIAGPDNLDPRQCGLAVEIPDYVKAASNGVDGLRLALLKEGFGHTANADIGLPASEEVVDRKVQVAAEKLKSLGAIVDQVSIPAHTDGLRIFYGFYTEGAADQMIRGNFVGTNWMGYYNQSLAEHAGRAMQERPNDLSPAFKGILLLGEYLKRTTHGRYYAIGQNLRRKLRKSYDEVFSEYDALLFPTTPFRATPIPSSNCDVRESVSFAMRMIGNTCQFGVTGHPAISVPCGMEEDLPIGLQIVGRHFNESMLLRIASAIEGLGDWVKL